MIRLRSSKTQIVVFNKNKKIESNIKCKIKEEKIKSVKYAKFLGIYFDKEMSFVKQIKEVQEKVEKVINILRYMNKVSWV